MIGYANSGESSFEMQQTAYARIAYERRGVENKRKGTAENIRKRKTILQIIQDFLRKLIAFLFTQVGVCALLVIYNIIGAFTFRELEGIQGDASIENTAGLNKKYKPSSDFAKIFIINQNASVMSFGLKKRYISLEKY